ncbi:MAG: ACP S-malonyltransferase [Spirochaetaceae bacterium]|nr:ACP S-malonyltransferase [Spirochaetaceae bacterium]
MSNRALIFPGQGSQSKGMALELLDNVKKAKDNLEQAQGLADFDIVELFKNDSQGLLSRTRYTQPALFIASAMYLEKIKQNEMSYQAVAGHSLGEYSALYGAGVITFEDGLKLVLLRGKLMDQVDDENLGMAALIGGDLNKIKDVIDQTDNLYIANLNSPVQTVISGSKKAMAQAEEKLKEAGARRVIPLKVSGAFHSPFMNPVKESFQQELKKYTFMDSKIQVYPNVKAMAVNNGEELKQCLIDQITGQVRWTETINKMKSEGYSNMLECGPGKVLCGLVSKIDNEINCSSVQE